MRSVRTFGSGLGVDRRDVILFTGAALLALGFTIVWHLFIVEPISNTPLFRENPQRANKYMLTAVMFAISLLVAIASLLMPRRDGERRARRDLLSGFLVRFGLALEIAGTLITPIGLLYSTDPTRSVPVGFAAFTCVFVGLVFAAIGANMQVRRT